jgi:hypothetical protein
MPVFERANTFHALDCRAAVTGYHKSTEINSICFYRKVKYEKCDVNIEDQSGRVVSDVYVSCCLDTGTVGSHSMEVMCVCACVRFLLMLSCVGRGLAKF